jgi:uncharacterized protein (DUF433 family)
MTAADAPPQADIPPQAVPLTRLPNGTLRVTGTRIPLERIVESYKDGESAEGIVESFDSLKLADVYAVISYYLNHVAEVEAYLQKQEQLGDEIQRQIEATQPRRPGFRAELMARWLRMEAEKHAAAGQ